MTGWAGRNPRHPVRRLTLTTPPTDLPVTLTEAREACQVLWQGDDAQIMGLIHAATSYIDGMDGVLGRAIMPQEWTMTVDNYSQSIELPLPPFREIVSVAALDEEGAATALAATEYRTIGTNPATLLLPANTTAAGVQIVFGCGYDDVPDAIRYAVLMLVRHWYDFPGIVVSGAVAMHKQPMTVEALLAAYKVHQV
jgi:uncharacterized phiE125 gp8 family phage protein